MNGNYERILISMVSCAFNSSDPDSKDHLPFGVNSINV